MNKFITSAAVALLSTSAFAADIMSSGYRAFGAPVNYNYVGVSLGGGKLNPEVGNNSELSVSKFTAQMLASKNILVNLEYEGRFTHHDGFMDRADYYTAIVGYRMVATEKSDLVMGVKIGGASVERKIEDTDVIDIEESNFLSGINLGYYYGLTDSLDSRFIVEYLDTKRNSETTLELGVDYYLNTHFSVGGYGKMIYTEKSDMNHLGISAKLRF